VSRRLRHRQRGAGGHADVAPGAETVAGGQATRRGDAENVGTVTIDVLLDDGRRRALTGLVGDQLRVDLVAQPQRRALVVGLAGSAAAPPSLRTLTSTTSPTGSIPAAARRTRAAIRGRGSAAASAGHSASATRRRRVTL